MRVYCRAQHQSETLNPGASMSERLEANGWNVPRRRIAGQP